MKFWPVLLLVFAMFLSACGSRTARVVLLPDTQTYAELYPEVFQAQIDWVVANAKDIDLVLQQGDLTQNNNDKEWAIIKNGFSKINYKLPYVLAAGNHDMGSADGKFADTRNTNKFNTFFPQQVMEKLPAFGGVAQDGYMENAYYLLKMGGVKWLVLTLEFGPRNSTLQWASDIINKYPNRLVILNTHCYMYSDSTRQGVGDNWRPQGYGVGKETGAAAVNDGEQIWEKLVAKHANVRWVFSGHILNTGVGTLVSKNNAGYNVYQMLANYQSGVKGSIKGGNGYLRIVDFNFKKNTMQVQTYSPFIQEYHKSPEHNFTNNAVDFGVKK